MSSITPVQNAAIAELCRTGFWREAQFSRLAGTQPVAARRRFRWALDAVLPLALTTVAGVAVSLPAGLSGNARLALFAFAVAVILWSTTALNATFVALAGATLLVVTGGVPQDHLFDALASDVIWLMIGAFFLGEAILQTGLAGRMTMLVGARAKTVGGALWLVTAALIPLTFLIPSTSGRAAIAVPVFRAIAGAAEDRRVSKALALLMPTVILVSTVSALVGAGSHLIADDLLGKMSGQRISFGAWALYGLPFGIVASAVSCWTITRLFLDRDRMNRTLPIPQQEAQPLSAAERRTMIVVAALVGLWLSQSWHGLEIATVTLIGALVLTLPGLGVLTWKDGLKSVSWNLVVFVGAALVLGSALIDTGAARWIVGRVFSFSGLGSSTSVLLVVITLALVTLTSHIYMTSHSARAAALVPPLLYLGASLELNPMAVVFLGTVGMDFCLTFPVSSKALLMFQELDEETFQPADLLKLSAVLLPIHLLLMVVFYFGFWQWVGLAL